ncbi:MAG: hypothetical protein U5M53_02240 [Rhodoferax sp.]|nr:hypothetical protein [Rhodoferax sp.]
MRRFLAAIILLCMAGLAAPAAAGDTFHGNGSRFPPTRAGAKPAASPFARPARPLQIIANNDWTAVAETGDSKTAGGAGFWKRGTRKTYAGKEASTSSFAAMTATNCSC